MEVPFARRSLGAALSLQWRHPFGARGAPSPPRSKPRVSRPLTPSQQAAAKPSRALVRVSLERSGFPAPSNSARPPPRLRRREREKRAAAVGFCRGLGCRLAPGGKPLGRRPDATLPLVLTGLRTRIPSPLALGLLALGRPRRRPRLRRRRRPPPSRARAVRWSP